MPAPHLFGLTDWPPDLPAEWISLCVVLSVIILTTYGVLTELRHSRPLSRALTKALEALKAVPASTTPGVMEPELQRISQCLEHHDALRAEWTEFTEGLVAVVSTPPEEPPTDRPPERRYFNSLDAAHFFNGDRLYRQTGGRWRELQRVLPTVLPGIGILGTFLGLVLSLPSFGNNLASEALITDAVPKLISGLGLAFVSSLWGVGASVILRMTSSVTLGHLLQPLGQLTHELDRRFVRWSDGRGLLSIRESLLRLEQKQEATGRALDQGLSRGVEETLAPEIRRMAALVERVADFSTESQLSGMETIVKRFLDSMQQELRGEFEGLGLALRQAKGAADTYGAVLAQGMSRLDGAVQAQNDTLAGTTTAIEALQSELTRLHRIQQTFIGTSEALQITCHKLGEAAQTIEHAGSGIAQTTGVLERRVTALHQSLTQVDDATQASLNTLIHSVGQVTGGLSDTASDLRLAGEQFTDGFSGQLNGVLTSLDAALAGAIGPLKSLVEDLGDLVTQFTSSSRHLTPAFDELRGRLESLEECLENLVAGLQGTASSRDPIASPDLGNPGPRHPRTEAVVSHSAQRARQRVTVVSPIGSSDDPNEG